MDRRPSDRILDEWDAVTRDAPRPVEAPRSRRIGWSGRPLLGLAPLLAAAIVVAVGIAWLGGRESGVGGDGSPAPGTPAPSAVATPSSPVAVATSSSPAATPSAPAATPSEVAGVCKLEVSITSWEGAAGSRIANLSATNAGQVACTIPLRTPAQLIDGTGRVLAQTPDSAIGPRTITIEPGQRATTMALVSNVCGEPPVAPVTIRLDLGTNGVVEARPVSPTDTTVPPCNGPGQPSDMSIQDWAA
jgi:hypothetical protein